MAEAYVNFYSRLDPGGHARGAQAFQGRAAQPHREAATVGASAAAATAIELAAATEYAEIRPTSGDVFACILATGAAEADRTAAGVRLDEFDGKVVLSRALTGAASLYLWEA